MVTVLNLDAKTFIILILALKIKVKILMNPLNEIIILIKYLTYTNMFLSKFMAKLLNHSNNDYAIKLKKIKQLFYGSIYYLKLIKLEILKDYFKINLANIFIQSSKFFIGAQFYLTKKIVCFIYVLIIKISMILQ